MYQNYIGIDIGKDEFFVAVHGQPKVTSYPNNEAGFTQLCDEHKQSLESSLVVLETTGGYELALVKYLQNNNHMVHRANTRKVKNFVRSHGKIGKSDKIDALMLAQYGFERHPSLAIFVENPGKKLLKLVFRRDDLKTMLGQEKNRLKAPDQEYALKSIRAVIKMLEEQVTLIDEEIKSIYQQDKLLADKQAVLKTVPGIGEIVSTQLLAMMPELGNANRKQIASLGGLAPHPNESGKWQGHRYTRGGRTEVKRVLFMAAMTAARSKSELGDFYQKLVSNGKKKMVALTALMRKILVIANARLRDFYIEIGLITT